MNSFDVDPFGGDRSPTADHSNQLNDNHVFTDADFKAPDAFVHQLEALERKTFGSDAQTTARASLLKRFDPLADTIDNNDSFISKFNNMALNESRTHHNVSNSGGQHNLSLYERSAHNESTTLLKFNSPLPVSTPAKKSATVAINQTDANNYDLLANDSHLQTNELTLQERLLDKDRLIHELQQQLNQRSDECHRYESVVNALHAFNEEVVEFAAQAIDSVIAEKNELIDRCNELVVEKNQALEDLSNVEKNFYEVHNRYDKVRTAVEECKQKEEQYKEQILELMDRLNEKEQMFELLKSKAEQKIEDANSYIESARRECESEMIAIKAQLKRSEMKINGLQALLDQKSHENDELTKMVDELIANGIDK